ncbi:MAG: NADH:ubiquinone oxidoreductase [Acidimicrobiales bacterium]
MSRLRRPSRRRALGLQSIPRPLQALWIGRGLKEGVVTTRYPRRSDGYGEKWRGSVSLQGLAAARGRLDTAELQEAVRLCPTGAIADAGDHLSLDRGRCILCGRCVAGRPEWFRFDASPELSTLSRRGLVLPEESEANLAEVKEELADRVRALRRSVHVRHVDAGSDGSEEWEVAALLNPVYDVQRLGIYFTATPRHADLLLVTGVGTAGMVEPLRRTYEAMPEPRVVLAAGTDAISGGIIHPTYATRGGVGDIVPIDIFVPGSPPSPFSLLHGILLGVGLLTSRGGS